MNENSQSEAEVKFADGLGTFQEIQGILAKFPIRRRLFAAGGIQAEQTQHDGSEPPTLATAEKMVLETIRQVGHLAEMVVKFPELFNGVARQMPAWPVMHFKRDGVGGDFWQVLSRLELAEEYPLDTSFEARWHPSSSIGQYMARWIDRIHCFRLDAREPRPGVKRAIGSSAIALFNGRLPDGGVEVRTELESLLQLMIQMPALTKVTSDEWSRRVMVPLIMLCDAGSDEVSCKEPALKAIWHHKGVKSRGTFKSRLLTKVRQTLRSLARPT